MQELAGHPDHISVRNTWLRAAGTQMATHLYADQPYAGSNVHDAKKHAALAPLKRRFTLSPHHTELNHEQRHAKATVLKLYETQYHVLLKHFGAEAFEHGLLAGEAWWTCERVGAHHSD